MRDDYSDVQTDQLTEAFNRAFDAAMNVRCDTRGEWAVTVLREVIGELEAQRAIWHTIWSKYHTTLIRFAPIPLREEVKK